MKNEIGRIVTFYAKGKHLAGKIVASEELEGTGNVPDYSIVVEGKSGKRLTLPSYNDARVLVHGDWAEAQGHIEQEAKEEAVDSRATAEPSPGENTAGEPVPGECSRTETIEGSPPRVHQLDRIEAMLNLLLVKQLNEKSETVKALIITHALNLGED